MFQTHPDTFQYFPQFKGLNRPEEQKTSEVFQDHSEKVNLRNGWDRTWTWTKKSKDRNMTAYQTQIV